MFKFFKDKNGHLAVWQAPNLPLWGWIAFKLLSFVTHGQLKHGLATTATAFAFTWAYLEITSGISPFRRYLGAIVLVLIVHGFLIN